MKNVLKLTWTLFIFVIVFQLTPVDTDAGIVKKNILEINKSILADESNSPQLQVNAVWELEDVPIHSPQFSFLLGLKPNKTKRLYKNKDFSVFLPNIDKLSPDDKIALQVGDVWEINANKLLPFLQQFHPGATFALSGKRGAYACLRASTETHIEILFRFHADFNLMESQEKELKAEKLHLEEVEGVITKLDKDEEIQNLTKKIVEKEDTIESVQKEIPELKKSEQKLLNAEDISLLEKQIRSLEKKMEVQFKELANSLSSVLSQKLDERMSKLEKELTKDLTIALSKQLEAKFAILEKDLSTQLVKGLEDQFLEIKKVSDKRFNVLEKMISSQKTRYANQLEMLNKRLNRVTASYLTPSYFTGRLVINHKEGTVESFSLSIPMHDNNATVSTFGIGNPVDMFIPRMELIGIPAGEKFVDFPLMANESYLAITSVTAEKALYDVIRGVTKPKYTLKLKPSDILQQSK